MTEGEERFDLSKKVDTSGIEDNFFDAELDFIELEKEIAEMNERFDDAEREHQILSKLEETYMSENAEGKRIIVEGIEATLSGATEDVNPSAKKAYKEFVEKHGGEK